MAFRTKDLYVTPECELLELEPDVIMIQTSYHYEPGWDD